ncbi:OVARIAN TUMOR DOMAIN-containing deubiquitinating enzyme 10-like [Diprion similis]|uniref:OVARIAN TUMOR DOMAIN-containing deubiquitinating enzyme 10-like n=1 Tax=Diprion similis TaxID=362088 RepID=UPI001EF8F7D9|nr:OVARIAN TUMOR DOMAIN-containing deubiquitinating enzyme 10-like [Diprion similis]
MQTRIIKMIPDGNCLFCALAYCVRGTQDRHAEVRLSIVSNIVDNWSTFAGFITGNESNGAVIRSPGDYKSHMNKNGIYGGEAELAAAAEIFKICLIVYRGEQIHPHQIRSQNERQFSRLFTGDGDGGHFDVLQNQNKIQIMSNKYQK